MVIQRRVKDKRTQNRHTKNNTITRNKIRLVDQGKREEVKDNRVRKSIKSMEKS